VKELRLIFFRIEAQWITAKKDWREAKKRYKAQREAEANGIEVPNHHSGESPEEPLKYEEAMDDMRCVLYCHGGRYMRDFWFFSFVQVSLIRWILFWQC